MVGVLPEAEQILIMTPRFFLIIPGRTRAVILVSATTLQLIISFACLSDLKYV